MPIDQLAISRAILDAHHATRRNLDDAVLIVNAGQAGLMPGKTPGERLISGRDAYATFGSGRMAPILGGLRPAGGQGAFQIHAAVMVVRPCA
jgi:ribulose 1,5-bisphosphate synthetase/thiazole synthase